MSMQRDEIRHDDGNGFSVMWESTTPDPEVDAAFEDLRREIKGETRARAAELRRQLAQIRREQRAARRAA